MLKKLNWFDLYLVLIISVLIFLFNFSQKRNKQNEIQTIQIDFLSNNNHFITKEMVNNLLKQSFPKTSKVVKEDLDLNKLEQNLLNNQMIESSQVYVDIKGTLYADIIQKTAIAREISANTSSYIDYKGNSMPLSNHFSAHVPIVEGEILPQNKAVFTKILQQIHNDPFLKTSIAGIQILPDQSLKMIARDYNFTIEFGKMKEIDKKFNNYKAFVHYMQKDTLMDYYKNINLRFTEQVICTK